MVRFHFDQVVEPVQFHPRDFSPRYLRYAEVYATIAASLDPDAPSTWPEVPPVPTLRDALANVLEDVGVAVAERYWGVVRRVRGKGRNA